MAMSAASPGHHLLVVDDEVAEIALIREALGTRPIWLHISNRVAHAIHFLERRDGSQAAPWPNLVLLDMRLPLGHGSALLEERRRRPAWETVPVIAYSADDQERELSFQLGATEFLQKPATWAAWERMVDRLIAIYLS